MSSSPGSPGPRQGPDECSGRDEQAWTASRHRLATKVERALVLARGHACQHADWPEVVLVLEQLAGALRHDRANAAAGCKPWTGNPHEPVAAAPVVAARRARPTSA